MFLSALLLTAACTNNDVPTADTDEPTETGDTDPPTPLPVVDCTTLPGPQTITAMDAPRGYHGLGFDTDGSMVGWDGTSLIRATSPTEASLWIPNVPYVEQMEYHPNGNLIAAGGNGGAIVSVNPEGATEQLASSVYAYGVEIGPNGEIYTANQNNVRRITLDGENEVFLTGSQVNGPKVLNFSPDYSKMYVGTNNNQGTVYEVDLDENLEPIPPARVLARTPGTWHDGLGVDACGNLYVAEYTLGRLELITPEGEVSTLVDVGIGNFLYGHGVAWGSGLGEWSDHNLYLPLPYGGNLVGVVELGIPSREFNGGQYEVMR